jgi:multidrug efflux pump subunit AcrA (membrane-fusion protein)
MFARVWVPGSLTSAAAKTGVKDGRVFLPLTAIVRRAEMTGVYVLDAQGKPRLRQVRLGRTAGQTVEVLSGVTVGEQVLSEPASLGKKL